jgi:ABC-type multidrug transport system fused ATPase/permease subunit
VQVWYDVKRSNASEQLANDLRQAAYHVLLRKSITDVNSINLGTVISRLITNPQSATRFFNDVILKAISDCTLMVFMFIYLGMLSKSMLIVAGLFLPALAIVAFAIGRRTRAYSTKLNFAREEINTEIKDSLAARKEIRIFAAEAEEQGRLRSAIRDFLRVSRRYNLYINVTSRALVGSTDLITAVAFGVGAYALMRGEAEAATLVAFLLALPHVLPRFTRLAMTIEPYQMDIVPLKDLLDLVNWNTESETNGVIATESHLDEVDQETSLVIRNCKFSYPNSDSEVEFGDITFGPGELVAVVGESGAGKSTLFLMLTKILAPYSGSIKICGRELADWERGDLVKSVTLMGQDSFLFNRTISDNIAYGASGLDASEARIEQVSKMVHIHDDVLSSLGGYGAHIRNHGANLSGGQKRRLALARALVSDPRVLLLDEPFTGVPASITMDLLNTIRSLANGRITLVATHNPTVMKNMDRVLVFERHEISTGDVIGKLVAQGSHDELLDSSMFYREMLAGTREIQRAP